MALSHTSSPTTCNPELPQHDSDSDLNVESTLLDGDLDNDDDDDNDDDSLLEVSLGDAQHIASRSLSSSLVPQQSPTPPLPLPAIPSPIPSLPPTASSSNPATIPPTDPQSPPSCPVRISSPTPTQTPTKTPNLYINGLPPNFPEDELFALTAPYGEIRSVRTFTRHVGERSSGYGFVLFDTVLSAEKCIEGLRCYRNLHPSFSKQIHKIPGTTYAVHPMHPGSASSSISIPASESCFTFGFNGLDDGSRSGQSQRTDGPGGRYTIGAGESEESFKARMERLKDETSTNLYIEGLPLSIDEATMAALVSPHAIKSSRFFETKLSHPPRIIAFVRLETRAAAEEIIERLHGRMVRGWNDPGSRISVRFADTSEQRELRRAERMAREGDQSPSRLTIAQAALLNLRGQEYQAQVHQGPAPTSTQHLHHLQVPASDFVPSSIPNSTSITGPGSDFEVNPLRRHFGGGGENSRLLAGLGEYHVHPPPQTHLQQHPQQLQHSRARFSAQIPVLSAPYQAYPQQDIVPPDINMLLNSQQRGALPFVAHGHGRLHGRIAADDYAGEVGMPVPAQVPMLGLGQAQSRNGYTPAEELILRAHAQVNTRGMRPEGAHLRRGATSVHSAAGISGGGSGVGYAGVDIGMGVRAQRSVASTMVYPQQQRVRVLPPNMPNDSMSPVSEEDFHSNGAVQHGRYRRQFVVDDGRTTWRNDQNIHSLSRDFEAISLLQQQQQQQTLSLSYDTQPQGQTHAQVQNQNQNQLQNQNQTHAPHMRATTLPHLSSQGNNQHQRHYQHSSMSVIDGNRKSQSTAQNQHPNHTQNTKQNQKTQYGIDNKNTNNIFDHHDSSNGNNNIDHLRHGVHYNHGNNESSGQAGTYDGGHYALSHFKRGSVSGGPDSVYDDMVALDNATSPPLVSPALTYSSRTPATLSPATPFFGSFGHAGEAFEGPGVSVEGRKGLGGMGGGVGIVSASEGLGGQ